MTNFTGPINSSKPGQIKSSETKAPRKQSRRSAYKYAETPDNFNGKTENHKKHRVRNLIIALVGALTIGTGVYAFLHGKNILTKAGKENTTIGEKFKTGFDNFFKKSDETDIVKKFREEEGKAIEEARKKAEEVRKKAEEARKKAEEARKKAAEEARKKAEEAARKAAEEARKKAMLDPNNQKTIENVYRDLSTGSLNGGRKPFQLTEEEINLLKYFYQLDPKMTKLDFLNYVKDKKNFHNIASLVHPDRASGEADEIQKMFNTLTGILLKLKKG